MNSTSAAARKGWVVAASSIGAVEALKDQFGFCRWNYALRSLQQHAKTNLIIISHRYPPSSKSSSTTTTATAGNSNDDDTNNNNPTTRKERAKKTEESLNKVMHLSCWGPNSVRF